MPPVNERSAASATATLIAGAMVLAGRDPALRPLLAPGAAELSAGLLAAAGWPWAASALRFGAVRATLRAVERCLLPGILPHYLARKRAVEAAVLQVLEAGGCRQVVVLGAGLDALAWRRHREWPAVRWVEVDRPGVVRVKAAGIAAAGAGENLRFAAADLAGQGFRETLNGLTDLDRDLGTLFLAEGLLMYLPKERVEALFAESARWGRRPVRWAFTFFEPRSGRGGIGFRRSSRWVDWWLRARGEPFQWAASEPELATMLGRHGFAIRELWRAADLRERFLRPAGLGEVPLAEGEAVCVAEQRAEGGAS